LYQKGKYKLVKRSPKSIRAKVLALVILSAVLPTALVGTSSYWTARNALTEKLSEQLNTKASLAAAQVSEWFRERSHDSKVFASSSIVVAELERLDSDGGGGAPLIRNYLEEVYGRFGVYETLAVLDARRALVAEAGPRDRQVPSFAVLAENPSSTLDWESDGARLWLQSPIVGGEGKTVGWLVLRCNFDSLAKQLARRDGEQRIRITAGADRVVLAYPADSASEEAPSIVPDEGSISEYRDARGMRVLAAARTLYGIDEAGPVFLIVTADWDVAFEAVTELGHRIVLLSVIVAAFVIALAYGLVVSLTDPIEKLTAGAQAVSRGDYSLELPVAARDEIGSLTEVFNQMTLALKKSHESLERLSVTDELTKLCNRRQFRKALDLELNQAVSTRSQFSIIMIDVDHFKAFNDRFGHIRGDGLLEQVGGYLLGAVDEGDVAARYGGEEFVVIAHGAGIQKAAEKAEAIRSGFAAAHGGEDKVTLSLGVAAWPEHGESALELIDAADRALYHAKEMGRDRVVVAAAERAGKSRKSRRSSKRPVGVSS
jgi:diguanylate cyclase (GGDEF)-like protein